MPIESQDTDNTSIKVLILKRGQVKSKLTRFKTFFDSFKSDRPSENLTQLKLRLAKLEECWTEFDNLQCDIELLDIDNTEVQLEEREHFESLFFTLSAEAQDLIERHTKPNQSTSFNNIGQQPGSTHHSFESIPTSQNLPQIKLPTINLPTFSGNYEQFLSFSDSFQSLIHTNDSLSDIQKLHYLKSSLKGEAAQVIQSLELTSSNYKEAWELLEKRYKNLPIIIQKHIKALFDLPNVNKDSASCLRQLLDAVLSNLRALKALKQPTDQWDPLLIHLVASKLNQNAYRDWEMSRPNQPDTLPAFKDLVGFIEKRCHILETSSSNKFIPSLAPNSKPSNSKTSCFVSQDQSCYYCQGSHSIYQCQTLLKAAPSERTQKLKSLGLCFNCLKPGHVTHQCRSSNCRKCNGKHNTLLHFPAGKSNALKPSEPTDAQSRHDKPLSQKLPPASKQEESEQSSTHSCTSTTLKNSSHVLLSTAQVDIIGANGNVMRCRALLDNGSQSCLMTERIAQHLKIPRTAEPGLQISGIDQSAVRVNGTTQATLKSCVTNYQATLKFLIVTKITGDLPSTSIDISNLKIPNNVILADEHFQIKGKIDLLLGQEIFFELLCIGQIKTPGLPTLQKTRLGWIVGGKFDVGLAETNRPPVYCNLTTNEKIDRQLQNFWMLEEPCKKQGYLTLEEKACEDHFVVNTKRISEGRYIVKIPLKPNALEELGDTKDIALKRFYSVERRLEKDQNLRGEYNKFMNEYETLGHMTKLETNNEDPNKQDNYLPHHPVINVNSTTTKMRVVFDASAKSSTGKSLNDLQLIGPTIQQDIFSILLSFRLHNYVMTADIEKMFRNIFIDDSQRHLQKIIWRPSPNEPIQTYLLNTVTYGTASAPYLAVRTLKQLAIDESQSYPNASKILQRDFYVDDLITGCSTREEATELQTELIELLKKGGFNLRKWNANSENLLDHLPNDLLNLKPQELSIDQESPSKTLGLWWNSQKDEFQFKYTPSSRNNLNQVTKRTVLSDISKLYDPLGILSPLIIRSKMLLQEMWKLNLTWDESLPMNLHTAWNQFISCLRNLTDLRVPRQITLRSTRGKYEIHGFSDSSEKAYGAVVYLRHEDDEGNITSNLMCSKSRVAPLKSTSLPRLELCAALLLSELVDYVTKAIGLHVEVSSVTYWTDSTVTLAWIMGEPARWKTFIANRVAKIQELTHEREWKHISTEENPADLVSRGTQTKLLIESSLWWHGPSWLSKSKSNWSSCFPNEENNLEDMPEQKSQKTLLLTDHKDNIIATLLEKYSSLGKIKKILAWCLRFIKNMKPENQSEKSKTLNIEELQLAERMIIKNVQFEAFSQELKHLNKGSIKSSKILSLDPFVDTHGLLRVGGRTKASSLNYDQKHQILLPKSHRLTDMLVIEEHNRQLHCGPQNLLYALRQKYWIVCGRDVVRKIIHRCLKCFKARPRLQEQKMSDLPADRVNLRRPFLNTGVDYCGPFLIKTSKNRNAKIMKSYVAVFICLATKAVHLELVSDLTTIAFLAALRRFISRRGMCATIRSDNGKTFVGANRKLIELIAFFEKENQHIMEAVTNEGIDWKFNAPYSPHTGGIWEAAVKSLKYHLVRIVENASLTFEEFATILTQVEAVLNSRPLTPISNHPSDLTCLTPAHFLVGDVLTAVPEPCTTQIAENRLNRWQRTQQIYQHFWNRWSKEYLTQLQQRNKWQKSSPSLKIGDMVLLKEDNAPPATWPLGRVIAVHPGHDNLVRTATVKISKGIVTRNVQRLCLLPFEE